MPIQAGQILRILKATRGLKPLGGLFFPLEQEHSGTGCDRKDSGFDVLNASVGPSSNVFRK